MTLAKPAASGSGKTYCTSFCEDELTIPQALLLVRTQRNNSELFPKHGYSDCEITCEVQSINISQTKGVLLLPLG